MARIFITGSSDGIGLVTANNLIKQGHQVVLHARNEQRATQTRDRAPGAAEVLIADLSSVAAMKKLAADANKLGAFDTVFHNAGLGFHGPYRKTEDGVADVFAVNTLAPYVLTAVMHKPKQLMYMSSGLQSGGDGSLEDVTWKSGRPWSGMQAYSDSKMHDVMLAFAVSRRWKDVSSNAVDPGWVATKMGGAGAPGEVEKGADTATWMAGGGENETKERGSGKFWANRRTKTPHSAAQDESKQDQLMGICAQVSGVPFPES